jgi:hypothetical protein
MSQPSNLKAQDTHRSHGDGSRLAFRAFASGEQVSCVSSTTKMSRLPVKDLCVSAASLKQDEETRPTTEAKFKTWKCGRCNSSFVAMKAIVSHYRTFHSLNDLGPRDPICICSSCKYHCDSRNGKCAQCLSGRRPRSRRGKSPLHLPRSEQKDLDDDDSSDDGYQPHTKRKGVNWQKKNDGISHYETPVNKRNEKDELGKSTQSVCDMLNYCRGCDPHVFVCLFAYSRPRSHRKSKWKQMCLVK